MTVLPASTLALIDRMAAVDYADAAIDRVGVERAIAAHLEALEQPSRPMIWFDDSATAWAYVIAKAERAARTKKAGDAAWDAAGAAAWDAAWAAAWDAAWAAARAAAPPSAALDRAQKIWLPFVDAFEAGLFLFWITPDEVVAVPRPVIHIQAERLHSDAGPAVAWPTGERYWFIRGVQVPQQVVEAPETLTTSEILGEPNVEVRRVMMERFGLERLIAEAHATERGRDEYGVLWELPIIGDEPLVMVAVVNSTAEPDGTFKDYWLRVPPDARTPREAVAWTFDVVDYQPAVET